MQCNLHLEFEESTSFHGFMKAVEEGIKRTLGESVFFAWFKDVTFKSYDGNILILNVKNERIKNCIFLHYQNKFEKILERTFAKQFKKKLKGFELEVTPQKTEEEHENVFELIQKEEQKHHFNLSITLDKKYTFQNFLECEENRLSVGFAKHFTSLITSGQEGILQFSKQFFICGGIGNGKTHLAQAIAHSALTSGINVLYTTAERFLFNFQTAVKKNETVEFMSEFEGVKLLIIDDIHFVATKKKTMEEIKRVSYSVISQGGFVLFCSSGLPQSLPIESIQVKDFLSSSYIIKIESPTENFRFKLLKFKTANSGYKISDLTLKTLASKIHTNLRELEGAMARMVLHSQILNYEIDPEATKFITTDIFPHKELKKFSITEVQAKVCSHFGIEVGEMLSKKRVKVVLLARQIAIFICSKLTTCSYIEIGKLFNRTHSTVIHSLKVIEKACAKSRNFKEEMEALKIKIEEDI